MPIYDSNQIAFVPNDAIFKPLFTSRFIRWSIALVLIFIALLPWVITSTIGDSSEIQRLYIWFIRISDIDALVKHSPFAVQLAVSYGTAIAAAPLVAILLCFGKIDIRPLKNVVDQQSITQRILGLCVFILLIVAPSFSYYVSSSSGFSAPFFEAMVRNRLLISAWAVGLFGFTCTSWFWCLFELSNFWGSKK